MEVVSLTEVGPVGERIRELGIPVQALGLRRGLPNPSDVWRFALCLRRARPDVVQTWMYHADLLGGMAARLAGHSRIVWNIRNHDLDSESTKRMTIWTANVCAYLSRWLPRQIVCCSEASRAVHVALGYAADKMLVIPNGVDLACFQPDQRAAAAFRREIGVSDEVPLIGVIARFHPQKDHRTFVQAADQLSRVFPEARFVLCGEGVTGENVELAGWIADCGTPDKFHLLGCRDDVARIAPALDVATSCSFFGEAFSNAIIEAMACAVPCVVTDVGDSAFIVGDTGWVVPKRNPAALAAAWRQFLEMSPEARCQRGLAARKRAKENFDLARVVDRYQRLYEEEARRPSH